MPDHQQRRASSESQPAVARGLSEHYDRMLSTALEIGNPSLLASVLSCMSEQAADIAASIPTHSRESALLHSLRSLFTVSRITSFTQHDCTEIEQSARICFLELCYQSGRNEFALEVFIGHAKSKLASLINEAQGDCRSEHAGGLTHCLECAIDVLSQPTADSFILFLNEVVLTAPQSYLADILTSVLSDYLPLERVDSVLQNFLIEQCSERKELRDAVVHIFEALGAKGSPSAPVLAHRAQHAESVASVLSALRLLAAIGPDARESFIETQTALLEGFQQQSNRSIAAMLKFCHGKILGSDNCSF